MSVNNAAVDLSKAETRPCKACKRKLYFVRNEEGKMVPLDAVAPTFRIGLDTAGDLIAIRATTTFVSHFATCPSANDFSSSRKS